MGEVVVLNVPPALLHGDAADAARRVVQHVDVAHTLALAQGNNHALPATSSTRMLHPRLLSFSRVSWHPMMWRAIPSRRMLVRNGGLMATPAAVDRRPLEALAAPPPRRPRSWRYTPRHKGH